MAVAMNGGRRITVREAQIKTATVEIRALTINGRQVTQSLFWQLAKEDVLDLEHDEFAPKGLPWGRVNYFRPPCKDDHLHVVWQKGHELRRACVFEHGYREADDWCEGRSGAAQRIGDLRAWQLLDGQMDKNRDGTPAAYKSGDVWFWPMPWREYMNYEGERLVYSLPEWAERERRYGLTDKERQEQRRLLERYGTREDLEAAIAVEVAYMQQAVEQWRQRWTELSALDQLFIAV